MGTLVLETPTPGRSHKSFEGPLDLHASHVFLVTYQDSIQEEKRKKRKKKIGKISLV